MGLLRVSALPPWSPPRTVRWIALSGLVLAVLFAAAPIEQQARTYGDRIIPRLAAPGALLASASGEGRGREALSAPVLGVIWLLATHEIDVYWVSPTIAANSFLWQRITEGAWPRVARPEAKALIQRVSETLPRPDCRALDQSPEGFRLAICP